VQRATVPFRQSQAPTEPQMPLGFSCYAQPGLSPVVQDLHSPILLDPQLPKDDIVHTAGGIGPGVGFIVSVKTTETSKSGQWSADPV
jgi:hypothetical protein